MKRSKTVSWSIRLLVVTGVLALAFVGVGAFRAGPPPAVELAADLPGIGPRTEITVRLHEPRRGLSAVRVDFVQGQREETLAERTYEPLPPWRFVGPRTGQDELQVVVGRETLEGLVEGKATIRVTARRAPAWLRRPAPVVEALELPVKLRPPQVHARSTQTYASGGGCEAVVYRVGPSAATDGVRAGEWFFPGYPLPGGAADERFALFAAPYDLESASEIQLVARDDVGNEARAPILDRFTPRPLARDTIRITDEFLSGVVPAILAQTPQLADRGSLLDNYLQINGELRRRNAATLRELARQSRPEFLWKRHFLQLPNSKVTSAFADRRTYVYEGREVDTQDHLGFDLASVRRAEVPAANDGIVVLARYFGIYGNAVVVDHGYGLMSLYGHLSSIDVAEGQTVVRGEVIGRTGATGLAGGDHLHFTMLLHGVPVSPLEWWDGRWIRNRIQAKLGSAFDFVG